MKYLDSSQSIGALFSYLSTIIVKKSSWDSVNFEKSFIGTAYSHTFILLSIIVNGGTLKYIKDSLILCRLGNDSFATSGYVNRLLLDLNGYLNLSYLIRDPELKLKFFKIMTRTCPWYFLLQIKILSEKHQWLDVRQKLILFHFSRLKIAFVESLAWIKPLAFIILWVRSNLIHLLIGFKSTGRPVRDSVGINKNAFADLEIPVLLSFIRQN